MTNSQKIYIELAYREYYRRLQENNGNNINDKYAEARKQARGKVKK